MTRREALLPWEGDPQSSRFHERPLLNAREPAQRPVLYGPKGEPLTWPRRKFGFAPPEPTDDAGREG